MKDKLITKYRMFTIVEFEAEQAFLREQHQQGLRFVRYVFPGFYKFEVCEPMDVIYQLDYSNAAENDKQNYLQIFRDCGWEYLFDVYGWSYFRKSASQTNGNEEIFSDIDSKIDMLTRIFKKRVIPLIVAFLCIIIPQLFLQLYRLQRGIDLSLFNSFLLGFFTSSFILYAALMISFGKKLYALKQKYHGGR